MAEIEKTGETHFRVRKVFAELTLEAGLQVRRCSLSGEEGALWVWHTACAQVGQSLACSAREGHKPEFLKELDFIPSMTGSYRGELNGRV